MKNKLSKKHLHFMIITFLVLGLIISALPEQRAAAATYMKYYDYSLKKTINYEGTIPVYKMNGGFIGASDQFAILSENGVALGSLNGIFREGLGAKCSYKSGTKQITIKKNGVRIVMTVGSKTAYVNGEAIEMNAAPIRIKYKPSNIKANLVPTRFVAEHLGYNYNWDSSTSTVSINNPMHIDINGVYQEYTGTQGSVTFDASPIDVSDSPSIIISDNALLRAKEVFSKGMGINYKYNKNTGKIVFSVGDIRLDMELGSVYTYVNGRFETCPVAPALIFNHKTDREYLYVPGRYVAETLGYYYAWDSNTCMTNIKTTDKVGCAPVEDELVSVINPSQDGENDGHPVYFPEPVQYFKWEAIINADEEDSSEQDMSEPGFCVTAISAGADETGEYITVEGTSAIEPLISCENDYISIEMNGFYNSLGANYYECMGRFAISDINLHDDGMGMTSLAVKLYNTDNVEYYVEYGTDSYTIHFTRNDAISRVNRLQYLTIPLPEEVSSEDVTDSDLYHEKRISINIAGDYRDFFSNTVIDNTGEAVKQIRINYLQDNITQINLYTECVIGYTISYEEHSLLLKLDSPSKIYSKIVVIDAGHGDYDPGTVHEGYNEKDVNLSLAYNCCKKYFDDSDIKVYYTKCSDVFISLSNRAAFAGQVEADMFISVHHNSSYNKSANGTSVYYSTINTSRSESGLTGERMASAYVSAISNSLGTKNRGITDKGFVVVRDSKVPAVLLEIGFMSNPAELALIISEKFQMKAAKAIYDTTVKLFEAYPTGR